MYADVQSYVSEKKIAFGKDVKAYVDHIDTIFLFRAFAKTRHHTVDSFLPLLKVVHTQVGAKQMTRATKAIAKNIADEIGIVDGIRDGAQAHRTWRDWYLEGIGARHARGYMDIGNAYNHAMDVFIEKGTLDQQMGALLFLEASIPIEFSFILQKVESLFSLRERSRKDLVDHISHDAEEHYPELLALLPAFSRKEVFQGINGIYDMKVRFYQSLTNRL